jgi:hypothetical protein
MLIELPVDLIYFHGNFVINFVESLFLVVIILGILHITLSDCLEYLLLQPETIFILFKILGWCLIIIRAREDKVLGLSILTPLQGIYTFIVIDDQRLIIMVNRVPS